MATSTAASKQVASLANPAAGISRRFRKSIAVLPFENLSANQENVFFADGVQDEILTTWSRVADLKVISRTSVINYRQTTGNETCPRSDRQLEWRTCSKAACSARTIVCG